MVEAIISQKTGYNSAKWRMLLVTMFCYLFYYTGRQTFGFAIPFIEEELGFSKTTLGLMGTALLWSYAIGQAINGNLADKFGGRIMMSLGAVLSCLFNWIVSFGGSFLGIFIPWIGNGFVQSMGMAPGSKVLSNWWGKKERGIAFGLFLLAAGMSSILAYVTPLIVLKGLNLDWRWIFRLPVLLLLVGGIAFYLIARDRPEDIGYTPPDDPGNENGNSNPAISGEYQETSAQRYKGVLKNWRFILASISIGFQSAARYGLLIWVPVHFLGKDWRSSDSAWISIALPVGMALGAVTGGWISDKIFKSVRWKLISAFMFLGAVVSMIMFFLPKDHWLGISVLFLCGFFVYGSQSAYWALCPDLLGRNRVGTGVGIMDFFAYIFAGLVCPLIGKMIESFNVLDSSSGLMVSNTAVIFPVVAAACIISAILVIFIKR
jgi:MFS transporter, OPA family, glycerol-3-phosphate transporter